MKNIFLIGMPSSGKTSLGKLLAKQLLYQFIDLDAKIVEEEGASIAHIFKEKGEAYFRQVESKVLHQLKPNNSLVVATGGGTPCFFDNMAFIQENGLSIFLDVSPTELLRRMMSSKKNERPLFDTQDESHTLLLALELKYSERLSFYNQAKYRIQDDDIEIEMLLQVLNNGVLK
ncbi:MAG: shikimate kinase [Bacteroidota bacterium]